MPRLWVKPTCALLACIAILLISLRTHHLHQRQMRPLGRFTIQQALDRSETLCRIVEPQAQRQSLVLAASRQRNGGQWDVVSRDPAGKDLVTITWDAETGAVVHVGHSSVHPVADRRKLLTQQAAVQQTRFWLNALGIADNAQLWHLRENPVCLGGVEWIVRWSGA